MKRNVLFLALLAVVVSGCSRDETRPGVQPRKSAPSTDGAPPREAESAGPRAERTLWNPDLGTASIAGVVRFVGSVKPPGPLDTSSTPQCVRINRGPILDESLIVGPEGGLKNVVVWIRKGLEKWEFPPPTEPAVVDQKGCKFEPHVLAVRVGQEIRIRNSDPLIHNVHALPKRNTSFNFTQAQQGMEDVRTFERPETMIPIRCDIHPWMVCYVTVVPHPFFAVTGEDGWFDLAGLPSGEYTVEAIHERLGRLRRTVSVSEGQRVQLAFVFHESPDAKTQQ
ncbi:MAG TPA: hypothetical protein EYP14_13660 [Planctomycetaceae bacterium]|nr:hypothetical protein [Planctomycetaceae bacterium]